MKKILLITVIALFSIQIYAQETQKRPDGKLITDTTVVPPTLPDYYTGKEIISGTGFSLKKNNETDDYLDIGNINNVKFGTPSYTPAPVLPGEDEPMPSNDLFLLAEFTDRNQIYNACREALGATLINQFKSTNNYSTIGISFIVELNGSVSEVEFELKKDLLLFSIHPEKLYQLELSVKQNVTFLVRQRSWMPNFIPGVYISVTIKDL
ncbi:MAG: hypothetical protein LBP85_08310 [Prevotellaceae bacterium]|nr:hypothetical protein [Prevotellaceae bacterium]